MKCADIKKAMAKGEVPFPIGCSVVVPVYKVVSRTHDPKSAAYKMAWTVGEATVNAYSFEKDGKVSSFFIHLTHSSGVKKWVDGVDGKSASLNEATEYGVIAVGWTPLITTNDDIFTEGWAKKLIARWNGKSGAIRKTRMRKFK